MPGGHGNTCRAEPISRGICGLQIIMSSFGPRAQLSVNLLRKLAAGGVSERSLKVAGR